MLVIAVLALLVALAIVGGLLALSAPIRYLAAQRGYRHRSVSA
jgi:hypothetical protein